MASELMRKMETALSGPVALILSPDLQRLRRISLGTVKWPGQPPRKYLSGGSTLTDSDRTRAIELKRMLECAAFSDVSADIGRFGPISKMLLTYPVANASAESGKARGEAYREALNDVPPAILDLAIKRWNRGEAGDHDYRWAPAPAVLRAICEKLRGPLLVAIKDLEALLNAVSLDRALDRMPLESETPRGRKLSGNWQGLVMPGVGSKKANAA